MGFDISLEKKVFVFEDLSFCNVFFELRLEKKVMFFREKENFYFLSGGIGRVLFFFSCFEEVSMVVYLYNFFNNFGFVKVIIDVI